MTDMYVCEVEGRLGWEKSLRYEQVLRQEGSAKRGLPEHFYYHRVYYHDYFSRLSLISSLSISNKAIVHLNDLPQN
jgi:hypothetical protein